MTLRFSSSDRYFFLIMILLSHGTLAEEKSTHDALNEMSRQFGEFYSESHEYIDLLHQDVVGNNYIELELVDSSHSEIVINQINSGFGVNKAKVVQKSSHYSSAMICQNGSNNIALVEQSNGQNNYASIRQAGEGLKGVIIQDGSFNEAYLTQCDLGECAMKNHGGEVSILQSNDHNIAIIFDNSSSSYGVEQNGGGSIFINNNMNKSIYVKQ